MTGPPEKEKGACQPPSDALVPTSDLAEQYTASGKVATATFPFLAYQRPAWRPPLVCNYSARSPKVTWRGNVAHVGWQPMGLCLVEIVKDSWALAWSLPWKRRINERCKPFSAVGADRATAEQALRDIVRSNPRPVYPPMRLGGAA